MCQDTQPTSHPQTQANQRKLPPPPCRLLILAPTSSPRPPPGHTTGVGDSSELLLMLMCSSWCFTACGLGFWGDSCSMRCDCENGEPCDPVTGECNCASGWRGRRCDQSEFRERWSVWTYELEIRDLCSYFTPFLRLVVSFKVTNSNCFEYACVRFFSIIHVMYCCS